MPLDFHLGHDEDEASYAVPEASISHQVHTNIFHRIRLNLDQWPHLSGMSNYYADAYYNTEDLVELRQELINLRESYNMEGKVIQIINLLISACEKGIAGNLKAWVFSD